ncbi:hypothetical protein FRB97_009663 [Tulasnella sp. 331]|nr:hypothetical protein FRB97_009663 [Tulasnella sp. 331]
MSRKAEQGGRESAVTRKLNDMRHEAVRRQRNAQHGRNLATGSRGYSTSFTFNDHSLPIGSDEVVLGAPRAAPRVRKPRALGYATPPSWLQRDMTIRLNLGSHSNSTRASSELYDQLSRPSDRYKALTFGWAHSLSSQLPYNWAKTRSNIVPSLVDITIRSLFESPTDLCATLSFLPSHLRQRCSRYAALHCPEAYWEGWKVDHYQEGRGLEEGFAKHTTTFLEAVAGMEGEMIYVGNGRSAGPAKKYLESIATRLEQQRGIEVDSWEESFSSTSHLHASLTSPATPLTSLHLIDISSSSLNQLIPIIPPTLITLSLISLAILQTPTSFRAPREYWLKALSRRAPWLRTLDLSFNHRIGVDILDQLLGIDWNITWCDLMVLGLRHVAIHKDDASLTVLDAAMLEVERLARSGDRFGAVWNDQTTGGVDTLHGSNGSSGSADLLEDETTVQQKTEAAAHSDSLANALDHSIRTVWLKIDALLSIPPPVASHSHPQPFFHVNTGMADHVTQQETRKLKPIYDALDTGSYKLAIQTCNKLLKKQPQHETIRALKSLALLRSNKVEESVQICDELLASKPTDESVLGVLSHVLKNMERAPDISAMYEEAYKKQPQNEELAVQTFMALVRVGSWKTAQVIALRGYKSFKNTKYLFWSIMSAVLQAQNAGGPNPGFGDHTPMLLTLALRLIQNSPIPSHISPDYFWLHLTILKSMDKIEDAFELITSEKGRKLCEASLLVEELRRDIFKMKGAYQQEAEICSGRLKQGDRNWTTFLSLIDATFMMVSALEEKWAKPSVDGSNGEQKAATLTTLTPDVVAGEGDPEATPRATPQQSHSELSVQPEELIAGLTELLQKFAKEDGLKERGAHLAILHVERKVRARTEAHGETASKTLLPLLCQYFTNFSDKACCFEDLKPYVSALSPATGSSTELEEWAQFLKARIYSDRTSLVDVQRQINVFKLQRFSLAVERTPEVEHEDALNFLKVYFECLPVGKSCDKDIQPADDLALLAVNALVSAWVLSQKEAYLHQALVILEYASSRSKYNYQFRVLAIRLYRLLGANAPAVNHYHLLDIKLVQCDTLSHLILSRGSTFSLAAVGEIGMMQECITASEIYNSNQNDTPDMLVKAFQHEKYSQITEFVEFEDRLDNSLQRDLTRIEYVRMKFITEKLETESLFQELQELEFVVEKSSLSVVHHDNRDFSVIANYQPRGQLLSDQTTMGVNRGFQWLTVFLQLYIRAYARACKVESTTSIDLSTFRTSWLSEMTADEKEFLKFSQILHDWVPCPPLEPREVNPITADGTLEGKNGDTATELKPALSLPHVSQDGTPLIVKASKETAIKYFEDARSRCEAALSERRPLWEALHVATLAQEAFILIQIVSMPWAAGGKGKKSVDASFMQALKSVCAEAAGHLRAISLALNEYSEVEGTAERRKEFVDNTSPLAQVHPALSHDYRLDIGATFTSARKTVSSGIGKGISKVVEGH